MDLPHLWGKLIPFCLEVPTQYVGSVSAMIRWSTLNGLKSNVSIVSTIHLVMPIQFLLPQ